MMYVLINVKMSIWKMPFIHSHSKTVTNPKYFVKSLFEMHRYTNTSILQILCVDFI